MSKRAVVLAGGNSRRFGERDKALARVDGEPMLRRVCRAVHEVTGASPVVAVGTAERAATYAGILAEAEFVLDSPDPAGPLGGVEAAVERTRAAWLFLCGCDMPNLAPAAIEWLFEQRGRAEAVIPRAGGRRQPLHAWYSRTALETALDTGVDRLQAICEPGGDATVVDVEDAPDDVPLAGSLENVNTPAGLEDQ